MDRKNNLHNKKVEKLTQLQQIEKNNGRDGEEQAVLKRAGDDGKAL